MLNLRKGGRFFMELWVTETANRCNKTRSTIELKNFKSDKQIIDIIKPVENSRLKFKQFIISSG